VEISSGTAPLESTQGTDYAPRGTPITATAGGVVEQSFTAGNGNFVKSKTQRNFSTQYLHMSKIRETRATCQSRTSYWFSRKYWSCHWSSCVLSFWKNGVQVDALRLKLPTGDLTGSNKVVL
jgi:hypothetical protein